MFNISNISNISGKFPGKFPTFEIHGSFATLDMRVEEMDDLKINDDDG